MQTPPDFRPIYPRACINCRFITSVRCREEDVPNPRYFLTHECARHGIRLHDVDALSHVCADFVASVEIEFEPERSL